MQVLYIICIVWIIHIIGTRVGPDIRWPDIIRPDIDFCWISGIWLFENRISGIQQIHQISGIWPFCQNNRPDIWLFWRKFKIYPFCQLSFCLSSYITWQKWHLNKKKFVNIAVGRVTGGKAGHRVSLVRARLFSICCFHYVEIIFSKWYFHKSCRLMPGIT